MANQLGKFLPSLAEISKPLRNLLSKNNMRIWGNAQIEAFQAVKKALSSSPILFTALIERLWLQQMRHLLVLGVFFLKNS